MKLEYLGISTNQIFMFKHKNLYDFDWIDLDKTVRVKNNVFRDVPKCDLYAIDDGKVYFGYAEVTNGVDVFFKQN